MYGNRSFLIIGGGGADIISLIKGGHEIYSCNFSFQQGVDPRGKATTKVYGGRIDLVLDKLPSTEIIEWGMKSRKYKDGIIVLLDNENLPLEKTIFQNAVCCEMEIDYTEEGDEYARTRLVIQAEKLIVGNGINFDNEWVTD